MPRLPRLAHYYLGLVHGTERTSERLTVVSGGDPSSTPLTRTILDRPLLLDRLRRLLDNPRHLPFLSTDLEAELTHGAAQDQVGSGSLPTGVISVEQTFMPGSRNLLSRAKSSVSTTM
jgi:hypothetical protein